MTPSRSTQGVGAPASSWFTRAKQGLGLAPSVASLKERCLRIERQLEKAESDALLAFLRGRALEHHGEPQMARDCQAQGESHLLLAMQLEEEQRRLARELARHHILEGQWRTLSLEQMQEVARIAEHSHQELRRVGNPTYDPVTKERFRSDAYFNRVFRHEVVESPLAFHHTSSVRPKTAAAKKRAAAHTPPKFPFIEGRDLDWIKSLQWSAFRSEFSSGDNSKPRLNTR